MKPAPRPLGAFALLGLVLAADALAAPLERLPNVTLQFPPQPPVFGFVATNAFGTLTFTNPVAIVTPPGETNRLFVVEQGGRIAVITNLASPNRSVFLDISTRIQGGVPTDERGLLGLAFHPDYAANGIFYVFYTGNTTTAAGSGLHDILACYQVSPSNPNLALTNELILIAQRDEAGNHNGGDLHFGPDGYLYVSLGDEGNANDSFNNSQRIDKDFFSGMLRIDVDKQPGNLAPNAHASSTTNYAIPLDNPFIGATSFNGAAVDPANVRTELWAVGLRNPWRFSFDPATGRLYCGDVGQNVYEEVSLITAGGNYGWAYREGMHAGPKAAPVGFTSIDPIFEYSHGGGTNQGFAVMGGIVYRGLRISQLTGAYVFGDNGSGNIWSLRYDGTNVSEFQRLFGLEGGVSAFGVDPRNGDVLMANQTLDTLRRVNYTSSASGPPLPPTLSGTGAFTDLATLTPAAGIVPYTLNVPFWSDNALKTRWFSVPNTNLTITFNREGNWLFPTGTVWVKHFELELTNGAPASRRRLETRFLVKNLNGTYGVTYRWTTPPTNALLVAEEGLDEAFVVDDGGGMVRTQVWHYPGRAECQICHTPQSGFALGFNTPQLNADFNYGTGPTNQIGALSAAGYFNTNVTGRRTLRALAHATNGAASREYRVRSYLAANCAQCHQPGGAALALWDARLFTPTPEAGLVNGPLLADGGDTNNRVVAPGSPSHSMMLSRISTLGPGHMPPLATSVLDTQAIALLSAWITNDLPAYQTFAEWQVAWFGSTNAPQAAPEGDPDLDLSRNQDEFLLGTSPTNSADAWKISLSLSNNAPVVQFPQIANRAFEIQSAPAVSFANWTPLDAPGNEPFFSISNRSSTVPDPASAGSNRLYRARAYRP